MKNCNLCKIDKEDSEFYVRRRICKSCFSKRESERIKKLNPEYVNKRVRDWRAKNPDKVKKYTQKHLDKIRKFPKKFKDGKAYCRLCKDYKELQIMHKDRASIKSGITSMCRPCYNARYRSRRNEFYKVYNKKKRANSVTFRLVGSLRSRLHSAIKSSKPGSSVRDLGCTVAELKAHLEAQFQPGMTWENYGKDGWHIDHIKPLSWFDLTNRKQFLEAVHYTNLQPLWAFDNFSKGARFSGKI